MNLTSHWCQAHLKDGRRCNRLAACVDGRPNVTRVVCRQHMTMSPSRYDNGPIGLDQLDPDLLAAFITVEQKRVELRQQQIAQLRERQIDSAADISVAQALLAEATS